MEISLRGGLCEGTVITTKEESITFTVREVSFSDNPDTIDAKRLRYVETQEYVETQKTARRRIFQYKPREIESTRLCPSCC